ncbi:uncharacterized protein [Amphiura filiformis]|uniref:uncharacterized protein n=1 Tax=Amphiura filiformis TaxID=82378 RepID=UPI003B226B93
MLEYTVMESLKPYICIRCERVFASFDLYMSHRRWHTRHGKSYARLISLNWKDHYDFTTGTLVNRNCQKLTKKLGNERKLNGIKTAKSASSKQSENKESTAKYLCRFCDKTYLHAGFRKRHEESVHGVEKTPKPKRAPRQRKFGKFRCKYCLRVLKCKSYLIIHMRKHTGIDLYECQLCEKSFGQKVQLRLHMLNHTGEKKYECQFCSKKFSRKDCWITHEITTHKHSSAPGKKSMISRYGSQQNILRCNHCEKTFTRKSHLELHERSHLGEKPNECKTCGRRFNHKSNLKEHERIHQDVKPFKCDQCDYTCRFKSNLTSHARKHSGIKPYECSVCDKKFTRPDSLTNHLRTHSGEKPYQCPHCVSAFAQNTLLRSHIRSAHEKKLYKPTKPTADKPYQCAICERIYATVKELDQHSISHTDKFKCFVCDVGFVNEQKLKNHQKSKTHSKHVSDTLKHKEVV